MLTSLALTSRQISSFGVVWISGHLLPVYRIAFWASYFDIFKECESVAVEAVRGEGIATIPKIAITQLDVAVVVCIHVRCDGDYGSLLINLLGFEWHRTSCGIEPNVVVMVGRDSTTSLGGFIDVQAVRAIFGIGKSRSCGVDAVLPCSGNPVAGTWRCHVTVAVNKQDEDG